MARTWTLVTDLSLGASRVINSDGNIAVGNDVLYFYDRLVGGHGAKVWSWDGTNLTDISASSFPGNVGAVGKGICWFQSGLYFLWFDPTQTANNRQQIYKYSGSGTTWNLVYSLPNADTDGSVSNMACDSNRIAASLLDANPYRRLVASVDGTTWNLQTCTGRGDDIGELKLVGLERYTGYSVLIAYNTDLQKVIAWESGNNWAAIGDTNLTPPFAGYANGVSWWGDPDTLPDAYALSSSEDWGVTFQNPSAAICDGFFSQVVYAIDPSVIMYRYGNDSQAWTLDGNTFVADGTVAAGDIKAFFDLNSTLYCICDGNEVYSAGPLPVDTRLWIYKTEDESTWESRGIKTTGSMSYAVGGLSSNAFDVDADGLYLYLAVSGPQVLKMLADLTTDATISYNPGTGSDINLMAGDLSGYWVWASGDFGDDKVVLTTDRGNYWYAQNDPYWVGVAQPLLVGPGDDTLITTSTGILLYQSRFEGNDVVWTTYTLNNPIWAVDRASSNIENAVIGAYWYTPDLVDYTPNFGSNWQNITDSLPGGPVTALILG